MKISWLFGVSLFSTCVGLFGQFAQNYIDPSTFRARSSARAPESIEILMRTIPSLDRLRAFTSAYDQTRDAAPEIESFNSFILAPREDLPDARRLQEEIRPLLEVARLTPDEDGAWDRLAWIYIRNDDIPDAATAEQNAISICGNDYTYHLMMGIIREKASQIELARRSYSRAVGLYPRLLYSEFWADLSRRNSILASGALADALENTDPVQGGEEQLRANHARLLFVAGEYTAALTQAERMLNELPCASGPWELKGELDEDEGESLNAILDYKRAIFLDPMDPLPRIRLAVLQHSRFAREASGENFYLTRKLTRQWRRPGTIRRAAQYQRDGRLENATETSSLFQETRPSLPMEIQER